jgi:putative peptidoglycan lipid II flippase
MGRLLKSTMVFSAMTSISRVFGLIRDVVIAGYFGAGLEMDAFIVAFRIPNFLRRLFAEGGFSQAFVPVLSEYREQREHEEVRALVDQAAATLGLILLGVTVVGVIAAPVLIAVFAPGFLDDPEKKQLAISMLRITFPYILFISLTALAGGILNTYRQFGVPAFTPVLLNLSLIACAIWLAPHCSEPITALAVGVFIAGVVQLLFQFPSLIRLRLFPVPRLHRDREGVRRIMTLMLPTLFAVSITQINLLVDTLIASFLQTGSISWLYYSNRMVEFPLGVFGVGLATVILPYLSADYANDARGSYSRILTWSLRWVWLIATPAAAGLAILAAPVLITLFQYRVFTGNDAVMASYSLMAYTAGLPAFILIKVLASAFFSRQDTRTPVKIGVIAMLSNIVLNLLLVIPLKHAGLALATSLSAYINAGLLYHHLRREGYYQPGAGWGQYVTAIIAAIAAMATLLLALVPDTAAWLGWGVYERSTQLLLWVAGGMACYFAVLHLMGVRPGEMTAPT